MLISLSMMHVGMAVGLKMTSADIATVRMADITYMDFPYFFDSLILESNVMFKLFGRKYIKINMLIKRHLHRHHLKCMVKVVAEASLRVSWRVPLWRRMIWRERERPMPVPSCLVV